MTTLGQLQAKSGWRCCFALTIAFAISVACSMTAQAALGADMPWWQLSSSVAPSRLAPNSEGKVFVTALNLGDATVEGGSTHVTVTDTLPAGIEATAVTGAAGFFGIRGEMTCSSPLPAQTVTCEWAGPEPLQPYEIIEMQITVLTHERESGVNLAEIDGGTGLACTKVEAGSGRFRGPFCKPDEETEGGGFEAVATAGPPAASARTTIAVDETPTVFGVEDFRLDAEDQRGGTESQAGAHPFQLSSVVALNQDAVAGKPPALVRDVRLKLPPGLIGDPVPFPQCTEAEFDATFEAITNKCPNDTAIGAAVVTLATVFRGVSSPRVTISVPVFNLVPAVGEPLRLGFEWLKVAAVFDTSVRTGGDFAVDMSVAPDQSAADTPTGVDVDVHVPQEPTLSTNDLAEADLRNTQITLPEGMAVNPSSASGLEGCATGKVGYIEQLQQTALFGPNAANCPEAAKMGTVDEIKTPLLRNPLRGAVYLAVPNANPFGSLVALYLVAEEPIAGVRVKLAGDVTLNPRTGQLTATFENTPQLPFEDLKVHFLSGSRAALSTPVHCGTFTATASFTPWSGTTPATPTSSFAVTQGANGSRCADPLPFAPSLAAGSSNLQAGAFTPFLTAISREDGNQNLSGVTLHLSPGLLGKLASVTPCPEPQAAFGTCGPESLIGHTHVRVGVGPNPFGAPEGAVYLTQAYRGAPYGLSIAQPAKAGPFDLAEGSPCDCVVVRAKIEVDSHTAAITVVSDPLPTILQGIPVQLKRVNVTVDRPGFTFNPTNCSQLAITAAITSEQGATAPTTVPFEVANCATLPFKPKFTVATQSKSSKANGASLHVRVTSSFGQANISKVKVDLPKQLPSRLTTLQKACLATAFDANPASCPAASLVGTATAVTPVLKSPLTGPAYLVSHGAAAFPDLEIVLQGEGITLILDGKTDIKKGVTISSFNSVPDAPINSFDLVLPTGPHSALAANLPAKAKRSFCGQKLSMPTQITGQNGAVIKQTTKVAISGCPKHKAKRKHRRHRRGHKHAQRRK
jgi:hypothetical protein